VLTPIASLILGGDQFTVTAGSTFTVNGGRISGIPVGVVPPGSSTAPCSDVIVPNLFGKTVADAESVWTTRFSGAFITDPPTALPDDVVDSQTTTPPAGPGECVDASTSVTVVATTASGPCPSGQAKVPSLYDLEVAAARIEWTARGFTGAFLPATGSDTEIVSSQSVSSGHTVGQCAPITALVVVGSAPTTEYCTARILIGLSKSAAQAAYEDPGLGDEGFTGEFKTTGNPAGSVTGQKLTAGQLVPCSSDELVTLVKP
jgi:hypothetical protein